MKEPARREKGAPWSAMVAVELYLMEIWRFCDQTGLNPGLRVLAKSFPRYREYCIDAWGVVLFYGASGPNHLLSTNQQNRQDAKQQLVNIVQERMRDDGVVKQTISSPNVRLQKLEIQCDPWAIRVVGGLYGGKIKHIPQ